MKSQKALNEFLEIIYFVLATFLPVLKQKVNVPSSLLYQKIASLVDLKKTMMKRHTDRKGKWLKEFSNKPYVALHLSQGPSCIKAFPAEN